MTGLWRRCFRTRRRWVGGANIFYDALLPHVAKEEDQDRVSTTGYAVGYLGWRSVAGHQRCHDFSPPDNNLGIRLFAIQCRYLVAGLLLYPSSATYLNHGLHNKTAQTGRKFDACRFRRIADTPEASANTVNCSFSHRVSDYNDGIGVIITVAVIYGTELGFGTIELTLAILSYSLSAFLTVSSLATCHPKRTSARRCSPLSFSTSSCCRWWALPVPKLPASAGLTGTPSPNFVSMDTAVGQGKIHGHRSGC